MEQNPVSPLRTVLVIREKVVACEIAGRDRQNRPKLRPARPKQNLPRGARLEVSASHRESSQDAGDGLIHAQNGTFLRIEGVPADPRWAGQFVAGEMVVDFEAGIWMAASARTNPQVLKGRDAKGKPYFEPTPLAGRVQIAAGERLRVSTVHAESTKDPGDGTIFSSGLQPYLLVLECPSEPRAAGLYVEKEGLVALPPG